MDKLAPLVLDEAVEYRIYFANASADEEFAAAALSSLTSYVKDLSSGYLWNCEEFNLEVVKSSVAEDGTLLTPLHLYGITNFGDNLDDEWLIIYMLREASKQFTDLLVTVEDGDGQVLLIETADVLPRWLTPERAENRVFIHRGILHVIPQARHPGQVGIYPAGTPTITQAIQLVCNADVPTEVDVPIQDCLQSKLSMFPGHITDNRHVALCTLPPTAAHVLVNDPTLVAPAVQAFYARDPLQMRSCRNMKHFSPAKPCNSMTVNITFTKCLYAQLRQQRHRPGVNSGWHVPPNSDPCFVPCDLGMKLSYGLEILRKQAPKSTAEASNTGDGCEVQDMCTGPRWENFLVCLKQRDYFRGQMEGSKEHRRLMGAAKQYFSSLLAKEDAPSKESLRRSTAIGQKIKHLLDDVAVDVDQLRRLEKERVDADDEEWMSIDQKGLDDLLRKYHVAGPIPGKKSESASSPSSSHGPSEPDPEELKSLIDGMKQFMSGIAGPEGAEFPPDTGDGDSKIDFSAAGFTSALSNLLGTGEDEDSESDVGSDLDIGDFDGQDDSNDESEMKTYFNEMDQQLAQTDLGASFARSELNDEQDGADELPPVDVDMNLVKNLLASYGAQEGLSGPAANILHGMGLQMPSFEPSS